MLTRRRVLAVTGAVLVAAACDPVTAARRLLMAGGGGSSGSFMLPASVPPFDASWVASASNPLLDASDPYSIGEPNAIYESGTFKVWGASGSSGAEAMGYSTSVDGLTWSVPSQVLGQGAGVAGVVTRASVAKFGSTYHCYYVDSTGTTGNLKHATSTDGSTWAGLGTVVANNANANFTGWANSTVWQEGSTWYMLLEGWNTTGVDNWRIAALSSSDGSTWTFENSGNPLSTLEVVSNGSYGGPAVAVVDNVQTPTFAGTYHLWAHCQSTGSSVPTPVYHFTSSDHLTWTRSPSGPVYTGLPQAGHTWDQISDPAVLTAQGTAWLFYGGVDNAGGYTDFGFGLATAPATY